MAVSTTLPSTQSAVKVTGPSTVDLATGVPLPTLSPTDVLVRVACVSINHVDGKSADMSPSPGATSGVDFSGIVVALGTDVESDGYRVENSMKPVKVGDRVFGGVFGNNPLCHDNGAFAEYVAVPARLIWHVPGEMDFSTAATIGATLATVGLALFQYLQVPMPSSPVTRPQTVPGAKARMALVYGGGTATGAMAIQVLKHAGFTPITTCSPGSAARAMRLGAETTFDYKSPTCGADLREYTGDGLEFALDCITDTASMGICYEALGSAGGRYVALDAFPLRGHTRRSVVAEWVCTYTQFGHAVDWAPPYNLDARPRDREVAEAWYVVAQQLVDQGWIEPYPKEDREGGLAAVGEGMRAVWKGEIYGKKLAYAVAEELCC
ncbi:chaperonin 10-like protein [Thelonectria olida]|uniref:Chaperonin 10-like protein n=1 Tax=Thelonectria olida TaxID=1576542 RepID=A0A9P8W5J0_9HYPO|nr:chaperonin 10-like protein [Thelonectria olida]